MVVAAAAGFGTLASFGKLAAMGGRSTSTVLLFRSIVATTVVWGILGLRGRAKLLSGRPRWIALALGVVYAIVTASFFEGLESLSAGRAAIVFYTCPAHPFVISAVAPNERPTKLKLIARTVAIAGVGLIVGANPTGANPVGIVPALLAPVAYPARVST